MMKAMRVAIYGAGSLGTVLGAYMSLKGCDVELYNHNASHVQALNQSGAHVTGTVDFKEKVKAFLPSQMDGLFDCIFLMTKVLDNDSIALFLKDHLKEDGVLCTMQNGLPEIGLMRILGEGRVLGCTIGWGATLIDNGVCKLTSSPKALCFSLGCLSPEARGHLDKVKALLELMGPVVIDPNFVGSRWSKLLINASFSGMSTVTNLSFGEVCDNHEARYCAQAIIKECIEVAKKSGITLAPVQNKNIVALFDYNGPIKKALSYALMPLAMSKHRAIRASMLNDLARSKKCEIDAIDGAVARQARLVGVPCPYTDMVIEIVHGFENHQAKPGLENLKRFESLRA